MVKAARFFISLGILGLTTVSVSASQIETIVTFGDSYTDQSRWSYFFTENAFPPKDYLEVYPPLVLAFDGGTSWVRYAEIYGDVKVSLLHLYVNSHYSLTKLL